jgi:hypothetical protein
MLNLISFIMVVTGIIGAAIFVTGSLLRIFFMFKGGETVNQVRDYQIERFAINWGVRLLLGSILVLFLLQIFA